MRTVHDLTHARPVSHSYVTIGVFDGVHRGHQRLIATMADVAHATDGVAVIFTFDPHPATVLGYEPPPLLTTVEERTELFAALGVDIVVAPSFTPATARTPAADFVAALMRYLRMAELWVGPDFALGYRREGNVPFLRRLGAERGFTVRVVEPLVCDGGLVSSSRVRAALKEGDIPLTTSYLGRPYRLAGIVASPSAPPPEEGWGSHTPKKAGWGRVSRNTGVHTITVSPPPERLIPASGVYACLAHTEHLGTYSAVTNVYTPPAFDRTADGQTLVIVSHLLDFNADLYNQEMALDFIARLRGERTFSTHEALVAQVREDVAQVRRIFVKHET